MLQRIVPNPNIDLSRSDMVGDPPKYIEAGKSAGLKTTLIIDNGRASPSGSCIVTDLAEYTLLGAIKQIPEDA